MDAQILSASSSWELNFFFFGDAYISSSSLKSSLYVTHVPPRILKWILNFWKPFTAVRSYEASDLGRRYSSEANPFSFYGATGRSERGPTRYRGFTITLSHTTISRTHLYEWLVRRRYLWLTKNNTPKRQTYMPPAGFEFPVPASEQPQTHALGRAASGTGRQIRLVFKFAHF